MVDNIIRGLSVDHYYPASRFNFEARHPFS